MGYDDNTRILEQFLPMGTLEDEDIVSKYGIVGLPVKGIAVSNQTNKLGIRWMDQAITNFAKTLKSREIVLNHIYDDVEKLVGRVKATVSQEGNLEYIGDINKKHPSGIADSIEQGYVTDTSVRALLMDFRCSICGQQVGECTHLINHVYHGTQTEGLVYDAKAVHLGIVVEGADPNANIGVAQTAPFETFNQEQVKILVQSINDSKQKRILEQQNSERIHLSTEEDKKLLEQQLKEKEQKLKELEDFKKSISPTLEQMNKTVEILKTENEKFKAREDKERAEKKTSIINQLVKISGEDPAIYKDRTLENLEETYSLLQQHAPFLNKKDDAAVDQAGRLSTASPKPPTDAEKNEMVVQGIGRIFNFSWVNKHQDERVEKDRNDFCRVLTQSAFSGGVEE